jgi:hypothetical protein
MEITEEPSDVIIEKPTPAPAPIQATAPAAPVTPVAPVAPAAPVEKKKRVMTEKQRAHVQRLNEKQAMQAKERRLEKKKVSKEARDLAKYKLLHARFGQPEPATPPPPPEPELELEPEPEPEPVAYRPVYQYAPHFARRPLRYAPMPSSVNFV